MNYAEYELRIKSGFNDMYLKFASLPLESGGLSLTKTLDENCYFILDMTDDNKTYIKSRKSNYYLTISNYSETDNLYPVNFSWSREDDTKLTIAYVEDGTVFFFIKQNASFLYLSVNEKIDKTQNAKLPIIISKEKSFKGKFQLLLCKNNSHLDTPVCIYSIYHDLLSRARSYTSSIVQPIPVYEDRDPVKLLNFDNFITKNKEKINRNTKFYDLLGELNAVFLYGYDLLNDKNDIYQIVGFSHYSRCFYLDYNLVPFDGIPLMVKSNTHATTYLGLTLKNILHLMDPSVMKLFGDRSYEVVIPDPRFMGEKIVIRDDNGKVIGEDDDYTFKSQYVNHKHPLWDQFNITMKLCFERSKEWNVSNLKNSFCRVYDEYLSMNRPPLYFKCQILMSKRFFRCYFNFLQIFIQTFIEDYTKDLIDLINNGYSFENGKRIFAYMGERIYSFFCYYFKTEYSDVCFTAPVVCFKDGNLRKALTENIDMYTPKINNAKYMYFYFRDSKITVIDRYFKLTLVDGIKYNIIIGNHDYFLIQNPRETMTKYKKTKVLRTRFENTIYTIALVNNRWQVFAGDEEKQINSQVLISNHVIPEIVNYEEYYENTVMCSPNDLNYYTYPEYYFIKRYYIRNGENIYEGTSFSFFAEAVTEDNEKVYIVLSGKTENYIEIRYVSDNSLADPNVKLRTINIKTNEYAIQTVSFFGDSYCTNKNNLYLFSPDICLYNWDDIPINILIQDTNTLHFPIVTDDIFHRYNREDDIPEVYIN